MDFTGTGLDGKAAEHLLDEVGISTSKSTIPNDPNPPYKPSGLRVGMPAMTTRGFQETETKRLATLIDQTLRSGGDETILKNLRAEVKEMALQFPVPSV